MKAFKKTLFYVLIILLLLLVYGAIVEPRFLLDEQISDVELPNLPDDWDGKKIAFIADFQVGMWWGNTGMVSKAVDKIIASDIELVLIGGDFVYEPDSAVIDQAVKLLEPLKEAGVPVIVVLGNHDYSMMKKESQINQELAGYLESELSALGIEVLENEWAEIPLSEGGEPLFIVGIGSEWAALSDYKKAMEGLPVDAPRIIFMHNPVPYRDFEANTAPLTLAAHTHGGQLRLPLLPSQSWLDIARDREVIADGWSSKKIDAPGNRLYVNRGIGFSLIPIRLFCRPELSIFTLKKVTGKMKDKEPGQAE